MFSVLWSTLHVKRMLSVACEAGSGMTSVKVEVSQRSADIRRSSKLLGVKESCTCIINALLFSKALIMRKQNGCHI